MSQGHIAILGRQPDLSLIELEARYGPVEPFGREAALLDGSPDISTLGGTVKAGPVIYRGPATELTDLNLPLRASSVIALPARPEFGLSYYGQSMRPQDTTAIGLALKKQFAPARYVAPKDGRALTAAQLKFNRLLDKGFELLVAYHGPEMVVALTQQFQDIDWYTARDRHRPGRDAKVGMLPPKLAQILVNTAAGPIYDPFCGTGVIIMEALLMGRPAAGSDLDPAMVETTRQNLEWLHQQRANLPAASVNLADARRVRLPADSSIASEGYLGPALSTSPNRQQLAQMETEILALYGNSLTNWSGQLTPGRDVSICVPAWRIGQIWHYLPLIDQVRDLGYTVRRFANADADRLLYSRPHQMVGRQILLLRKK